MKRIRLSICFGLICAITLSFARFDALCQDLRDNVFRLHIIANSNSTEDQALKLKVRDAILNVSEDIFLECADSEQAIISAQADIELLRQTAKNVIIENGFDYEVNIDISPSYFENREYDNFTLPAGEYMALNIKIGEAKGKNWWCVMFPAVCIGASCELNNGVNDKSAKVAEGAENYVFRFKTVEIYENLKKYFKKI